MLPQMPLSARNSFDGFFFNGGQNIASNSSETIKDRDPNSLERHCQRVGLFNRLGFEGHGKPEVPKKPEVNRDTAILV